VLAAAAQQERLIEALLTLARGQTGFEKRETFDLSELTHNVLLGRRAEAKRRGLELREELVPAPSAGDPRLVERLVANLVDNALRYNVPCGHVSVATGNRSRHTVLSVANTIGPVVPIDVDRLFEPFQRFDNGRTSHGEGLGLGLSIVRRSPKPTARRSPLTLNRRAVSRSRSASR
jgi:signal transduction histidine kinase